MILVVSVAAKGVLGKVTIPGLPGLPCLSSPVVCSLSPPPPLIGPLFLAPLSLCLDWLPPDAAWQMDRRVSDLWPLSGIADTQSPWKYSGWPRSALASPSLFGFVTP